MRKILLLLTMLLTCSGLYAKQPLSDCKIKSQEEIIFHIKTLCDSDLHGFLEETCEHWRNNKTVMRSAVKQKGYALQAVRCCALN